MLQHCFDQAWSVIRSIMSSHHLRAHIPFGRRHQLDDERKMVKNSDLQQECEDAEWGCKVFFDRRRMQRIRWSASCMVPYRALVRGETRLRELRGQPNLCQLAFGTPASSHCHRHFSHHYLTLPRSGWIESFTGGTSVNENIEPI